MKITVYLTRAQIRALIGATQPGQRGYLVARRAALYELQCALGAADSLAKINWARRMQRQHRLAGMK